MRLQPDPLAGTVQAHPQLPTGWNFFTVHNLTTGGGHYDLHLSRTATGFSLTTQEQLARSPPLTFVVAEDGSNPVTFV